MSQAFVTRSQRRRAELLARDFAGKDVEAGAALDDDLAVDDHCGDAGRMAAHFIRVDFVRQPSACEILDLVGIEDGDVRRQPGLQAPAVEAQLLRRQAGNLVHRLFERK